MRNTRLWLAFSIGFLLILLNACAYTQHSLGPDNAIYEKPAPADSICVMLPPDIAQGSRVYFDSGRADPEKTVANRIFLAVYPERPSSILIETADEDRAIQQCSSGGAKYLLSPLVLHWQGRASEWSFMRNVVQIEIRLIKVEPKTFMRSAFFEARNGWLNSGSDDPAELLLNNSFAQSIADLID